MRFWGCFCSLCSYSPQLSLATKPRNRLGTGGSLRLILSSRSTTTDSLLNAQQASLQAILDEIGRRMHIAVVAQIPAQEKITLAFDWLFVEERVAELSTPQR